RHIFHREVRNLGVWIKAQRPNNVRMHQAMDRHALALQVAEELRIGRNLDGHKLVGPDMMVRPPDFAERAAIDFVLQDVFTDSLIDIHHKALRSRQYAEGSRQRQIPCLYSAFCLLPSAYRLLYLLRNPVARKQIIRTSQKGRSAEEYDCRCTLDSPSEQPSEQQGLDGSIDEDEQSSGRVTLKPSDPSDDEKRRPGHH